MSSARDNRQRAAARARLEREMAARLEAAARRRRMIRSVAGASVAGIVVIGAVIWIITALGSNSSTPVAAGPTGCVYDPAPTNPASASPASSAGATAAATTPAASPTAGGSASPSSSAVSPFPDTNPPRSGYRTMTIVTNLGTIKIEMDLAKVPCTASSMVHLAQNGFYVHKKNTGYNASCHRLVKDIFALQCGDPTGTGTGGPGYKFGDENVPKDQLPAYHEGDVAMANGGPNTNGSQFFFVYQTSSVPGNYTLWGHVIQGLDVVKKVAAGGDDEAFADPSSGGAGGGHPLTPLIFLSVEVGPVYQTSLVTPAPTASATPSGSPSASPSASAG